MIKNKKRKKSACYLDGRFMPLEKATLGLMDIGVLRAYAVFDVMYARGDKPFLLKEHWRRLRQSAKDLGLKLPVDEKGFSSVVDRLLKTNGFEESVVRTVLTGGVSEGGYLPGKETFYIVIKEFKPLPETVYSQGAKIITLDFCRQLPYAKTTNYVTAIKNDKLKIKKKALEICFIRDGKVLEAATSNIFIVKGGRLITACDDILKLGTIRNLVVKLARKMKITVEEREVNAAELFGADEVFLTATNKGIVPVVKADNDKIANGRAGDVTKTLMKELQEYKDKVVG